MASNQHPFKISDFTFQKMNVSAQGFTNVVVYDKDDNRVHSFQTDNPTTQNIESIIEKWMNTLFVNIDPPTKITIVLVTSTICNIVKTRLRSIVDCFYEVTRTTFNTIEFDGFDTEQCVDAQETLRLELLNIGLTERQFKIVVS